MEDVDVPNPNPFIAEWLVSARCRSIMFESGELYEALYREVVAKRTGQLARSTHVSTGIEGDRWVAFMTAGFDGAPYVASEEFGAGEHPGSTGRHFQPAAHDLNTILDMMGSL
jgi:hypothetical protein